MLDEKKIKQLSDPLIASSNSLGHSSQFGFKSVMLTKEEDSGEEFDLNTARLHKEDENMPRDANSKKKPSHRIFHSRSSEEDQ